MIDKPTLFGKPQIYLEKSPDALVVLIAVEQSDITFKGRLHEGGADGRIVGVFQFRSMGLASTSPAYPGEDKSHEGRRAKRTAGKAGRRGYHRLLRGKAERHVTEFGRRSVQAART